MGAGATGIGIGDMKIHRYHTEPMVEQSPLTQVKHEAKPLTGPPQMPNGRETSPGSASGGLFQPSPAIEDRRALIAELRKIKDQLEAKLPAMALVRVTNLIRRIDRESEP